MRSPSGVCACLLLLALLAVPSISAAVGREANATVAVPADGGSLREESSSSSTNEDETPSTDETTESPEAAPDNADDGDGTSDNPS